MLKVCVIGASGRMGSAICQVIEESLEEVIVSGKISSKTSVEEKHKSIEESDVVIDFSLPEALAENLELVVQYKKPVVIGVTGIDDNHVALLKKAAKSVSILYTANTSIGVAILKRLVSLVGNIIRDNGFDNLYDIKITDIHHKDKRDAPSGTALSLLDEFVKSSQFKADSVKVESERYGDVIGEHSLILSNDLESIELSHKAKSRLLFAKGAVDLARWLYAKQNHDNEDQKTGFYTMEDVICV